MSDEGEIRAAERAVADAIENLARVSAGEDVIVTGYIVAAESRTLEDVNGLAYTYTAAENQSPILSRGLCREAEDYFRDPARSDEGS